MQRDIKGDPLKDLPELPTHPRPFVPTGRFTQERKEIFDKNHDEGFLWEEELALLHNIMMDQESGFAWCAEEGGSLKHEYFPPVKMPVIPHEPYVEKNIPIPPGISKKFVVFSKTRLMQGYMSPRCRLIKQSGFVLLRRMGKVYK